MSDLIPQIPNIDNGNKEIPDINIGIRSLRFIRHIGPPRRSTISNINVDRIWVIEPSQAIPYQTPITTGMGTPIVDMPGCVMVNKENAKRPPNKNKQLVNDDPKQNVVLCDGGMPYFTAPNYDARELSWQTVYGEPEEQESGIDTGDTPDLAAPETPERPNTEEPEGDPDCPGPLEPRLGSVGPNEKEKVSGYELQRDPTNQNKKICVILYEDIGAVEQFLPSAQVASVTASIAAVAGASALLAKPLAELLTRTFKPVIKQVLTKVNKILGKETYKPTRQEILADEYRKKKDLPPLKKGKKKKKS